MRQPGGHLKIGSNDARVRSTTGPLAVSVLGGADFFICIRYAHGGRRIKPLSA
jgi:hypothetical protein